MLESNVTRDESRQETAQQDSMCESYMYGEESVPVEVVAQKISIYSNGTATGKPPLEWPHIFKVFHVC